MAMLSAGVVSNNPSQAIVNEGTVIFTVKTTGSPSTTIRSEERRVGKGNGAASVSYVIKEGTAAGSYSIQAVYSGTSNFSTSYDTSKTLTINAAGKTMPASHVTIVLA